MIDEMNMSKVEPVALSCTAFDMDIQKGNLSARHTFHLLKDQIQYEGKHEIQIKLEYAVVNIHNIIIKG